MHFFLAKLTAALAEFEESVKAEEDFAGWEKDDLAEMLGDLRILTARLGIAATPGESRLARLMSADEVIPLTAGGSWERKWSSPSKAWRHNEAAAAIAEKIIERAVDPETGTLEMPYSQMVLAILEYGHVDYWRSKVAKTNLGVDVNRFCEKGDGQWNLVYRKPSAAKVSGDASSSGEGGEPPVSG